MATVLTVLTVLWRDEWRRSSSAVCSGERPAVSARAVAVALVALMGVMVVAAVAAVAAGFAVWGCVGNGAGRAELLMPVLV